MKNIPPTYMMATDAKRGNTDLSRPEGDICVVNGEDKDHYFGQWITGFGYISVEFPKATTRPLTADEVEKYHGKVFYMGNTFTPAINLKGEDFAKKVVITHKGTGKAYNGILAAPIRDVIAMYLLGGKTFLSSKIQSIIGNEVTTLNSTYVVEYL